MQAICTEVEERLWKHKQRSPEHREGHRSADWALLDFGGFIVHVFSEQARRYYDLERLWRLAPKLEIPDAPEGALSGTYQGLRAADEAARAWARLMPSTLLTVTAPSVAP